jgi:hypothetical protein
MPRRWLPGVRYRFLRSPPTACGVAGRFVALLLAGVCVGALGISYSIVRSSGHSGEVGSAPVRVSKEREYEKPRLGRAAKLPALALPPPPAAPTPAQVESVEQLPSVAVEQTPSSVQPSEGDVPAVPVTPPESQVPAVPVPPPAAPAPPEPPAVPEPPVPPEPPAPPEAPGVDPQPRPAPTPRPAPDPDPVIFDDSG